MDEIETDIEAAQDKSKSQLKRDMHALQKLGESLVALKPAQLQKIPLPEKLQDAIEAAKRMRSRVALKRQRQYIGRVMRDIDAQPIQAAYQQLNALHREQIAQFHSIEKLRDDLIEQGDVLLTEVLKQYPNADRAHLRQLVRQAQKSAQNKHRRTLYRYLNTLTLGTFTQ